MTKKTRIRSAFRIVTIAVLLFLGIAPPHAPAETDPPHNVREVSVHVIDAKTRKPIKNVKHFQGNTFDAEGADWIEWEYTDPDFSDDGVFHFSMKDSEKRPREGSAHRFEAEGYPIHEGGIELNSETGRYEVAIEPAEPLVINVLLPDGSPASNIPVGVVQNGDWASFHPNGSERRSWMQGTVRVLNTDKSGRANVFGRPGDYLIAMHEQGVALCVIEAIGKECELRMIPWGRLEGRVHDGSKAVSGGKILFEPNNIDDFIDETSKSTKNFYKNSVRIKFYDSATIDATGKYVFEKVFPKCSARVEYIRDEHSGNRPAKSIPVTTKAGQMVVADIGGKGIQVKGRLVFPKGLKPRDLPTTIELRPVSTNPDPEKRKEEERRRKGQGEKGSFIPLKGDFRFSDIEPGDYQIYFSFNGYMAPVKRVINIPTPENGKRPEIYDLGEIECNNE